MTEPGMPSAHPPERGPRFRSVAASGPRSPAPLPEVPVLGHDGQGIRGSVSPYFGVADRIESDVPDVQGLWLEIPQRLA